MFQISRRPNVNSVVKRAHCISFFFMIQEASGGETPHPRVQNPRSDEIAIELSSYRAIELNCGLKVCFNLQVVGNYALKVILY